MYYIYSIRHFIEKNYYKKYELVLRRKLYDRKGIYKKYLNSFKKEGRLKNVGEAKKRIEVFFDTLQEALEKDGKVIFKDWGKFEIKREKKEIMEIQKLKREL